jgi:ketosteroid isomerase-like protein
MSKSMTKDEDAICDLLDAFTRALYDKDAAGAIASLADDAVAFDLAPPLKQDSDVMHDPARLEEWFATWKSPIVSESVERTIVVDRDVAYAYGLQRMTGTKTDGEEVELFFRATACFRRNNGRWQITHMHNSVPFAMDGSDKALLHLKP